MQVYGKYLYMNSCFSQRSILYTEFPQKGFKKKKEAYIKKGAPQQGTPQKLMRA